MKKRLKKRWLVIPVVAGMVALAVTGGAIFAQGTGPNGKASELTTRVAEILGLEPSIVQEAFQQARNEQHEARLQSRLDGLVFTQDQADAIMSWYQARPEAAQNLPGILSASEQRVQSMLDRLVAAEHLTQVEADEVLAWYQTRPEDLPGSFASPNRGFHGHFRGHSRGQFKGQMFQRGMMFGGTGETDQGASQQSFRSLVPHISTDGVLQ